MNRTESSSGRITSGRFAGNENQLRESLNLDFQRTSLETHLAAQKFPYRFNEAREGKRRIVGAINEVEGTESRVSTIR